MKHLNLLEQTCISAMCQQRAAELFLLMAIVLSVILVDKCLWRTSIITVQLIIALNTVVCRIRFHYVWQSVGCTRTLVWTVYSNHVEILAECYKALHFTIVLILSSCSVIAKMETQFVTKIFVYALPVASLSVLPVPLYEGPALIKIQGFPKKCTDFKTIVK